MSKLSGLLQDNPDRVGSGQVSVAKPCPITGKAMCISIDCAQVNPRFVGGVTTYALGLLEGLANVGRNCEFRLVVSTGNQPLFEKFTRLPNFEVISVPQNLMSFRANLSRAALLTHSSRVYRSAGNLIFRGLRQTVDDGADVTYTPTTLLPYFNSSKPTVLSMHDIQHVHHPEFFSWARRLSRRVTYDLSAHHATHFQVSSRYIRDDLLTHFPWLRPEQIELIPHGVHIEKFSAPILNGDVRRRYNLPDRYLFYPAQLWPHKNHLTLLKALKRIQVDRRLEVPLVLTGDKYAAAADVFRFIKDQAMDYVRYLGKVPFSDLVELHQQAAFTLSTSLHEASSFPILEAAAAGTPVIASRIPAFEELGETLHLNLVDPLNAAELANLVFDLWNDERTAATQSAYNRVQIAAFSWENAATRYLRFFERIISR